MTLSERFWSKVNKNGPVPEHRPDLGPCWLWTASTDRYGYGRISVGGRSGGVQKAHRVAYELLVGPIPEGLEPDHLCRVRLCVRWPSHLELVTHRENVLRGEGVSATQARQTHCKRGHEFTPENTCRSPSGRRRCRTCGRDYMRAYRKARMTGSYTREAVA